MILQYLWKTFRLIFFFVAVLLILKTFIMETGRVNGVSMLPTFVDGEMFFINKYALLFTPPQRQDIIQARHPLNGTLLVKRVIGIPGDTVVIFDNTITITTSTGEQLILNEPYLSPDAITQMWNNESGTIKVGRDEYFILGDNRRESLDSRHYGKVLRKDIYGLVLDRS
jgi:signal peptidase I